MDQTEGNIFSKEEGHNQSDINIVTNKINGNSNGEKTIFIKRSTKSFNIFERIRILDTSSNTTLVKKI